KTCKIQEQVEIACHQPIGITPEVAPFIMIHETGGGYLCARRYLAQFALLRPAERPIDRAEFIILVQAHGAVTPPAAGSETDPGSRSAARCSKPRPRSYSGTARSAASAPGSSTKPSCCFRNRSRP